MRKAGMFILNFLHLFSNWTYKKFSINNYTIATIGFTAGMILGMFSIFDVIESSSVVNSRLINAMKLILSINTFMAIIMLRFEKDIENYFSQKYDTGNTKSITDFYSILVFVIFIFTLIFCVMIMYREEKWLFTITLFLLNFSSLFLYCEPPNMEIRMAKVFKEKEK